MALTPEELAAKLAASKFPAEPLMARITLIAQANSQRRTPVLTGLLRRSLTTRVEAQGQRGFVGTNIRYGPFVHNGTRSMSGRPFIAQGIADSREAIARELADAGGAFLASIGDI